MTNSVPCSTSDSKPCYCQSAADITVQGDATLLRMLLRNLVENAHRYSPQGSNIMIKLQEDGGAVMAVEDEGPGIDEVNAGS